MRKLNEDTKGEKIAWREGRNKPILYQLDLIAYIVDRFEEAIWIAGEVEGEGVDFSPMNITITLTPSEVSVIAGGMNLIGFFSEKLGEAGEDVLNRLTEAQSEAQSELTPEQEEEIDKGLRAIAKREAAKLIPEVLTLLGGDDSIKH